jgi:hypothetical protein
VKRGRHKNGVKSSANSSYLRRSFQPFLTDSAPQVFQDKNPSPSGRRCRRWMRAAVNRGAWITRARTSYPSRHLAPQPSPQPSPRGRGSAKPTAQTQNTCGAVLSHFLPILRRRYFLKKKLHKDTLLAVGEGARRADEGKAVAPVKCIQE